MDLIPVSFTIEKKCNELSNKDSLIFTDNKKTYITYNNTIYQWNTSSLSHIMTLPHKITAIFNLLIIGFENGVVKINDTFHKISTKKITCIDQNDQKIYFSSNNELIIYDLVQETFDRITLQCHINTFCVNDVIALGCGDKTVKIYKEKLFFEIALMEDVKQVFLLDFLYIFTKNKVTKVNLDTKKEETYCIKGIIKAIYTDTFYIFTREGIFTLKERIYKKKLDFFNFNFIEDTFVFLGRNEICYKKNDSSSHLKRFYYHESKIVCLKHFKNLFSMSHFSVIEWENKEIKNVFEFDDQIFDFCLFNDVLYVLKENCVEGMGVLDREIKFNFEIKANSFAVTSNLFCYSEKSLLKICAYKSELEILKEFDLKDDISFIKVSEDEKYLGAVTGNVVHVILLPKKKILTLYGHSLPITDIIFHNEKVFAYGMDKTVKVFGLDFGEVIKSISLKDAGNKGKLAVFDDHNWLLASNNLIHFEKFDLKNIYKEKCHLISIYKEELVVSDGKSILFMKEGDFYEPEIQFNQIVKEEELINQNEFDKFITNLENNNLSLDINLGELEKFIEILNTSQIKMLINQLKNINNLIMKIRVINLLYKLHREILLGNNVFESEMNDTFEKFKVLRRSVNRNFYLKQE